MADFCVSEDESLGSFARQIDFRGKKAELIVEQNGSTNAADCDTDHYLVVTKIRERLAVSKQTTHKVHMERFNLKKLSEVEGKGRYCVEISNRFAALENLDTEGNVNKAWETI
jgi:hypothetical protein